MQKQINFDNATALTSDEFKAFLKHIGIIRFTGAPFHPLANGLAGSDVKIMKNAKRAFEVENL